MRNRKRPEWQSSGEPLRERVARKQAELDARFAQSPEGSRPKVDARFAGVSGGKGVFVPADADGIVPAESSAGKG